MEEEVGGAEIRRYAEIRFACGYGEALRVDGIGNGFYSIGHAIEGAVEAFKISVLDRGGGCQDFPYAGSVIFCLGDERQKLKGEFRVVTERVHCRGRNRAGGCCGRRGMRQGGGR